MEAETYKVEEFILGAKTQGDKIIFKSIEDMERAYKEIDNGNNIYIEKDGVITKLLHQMISAKIYDGTITLSARKQDEKRGEIR